MMHNRYGDIDDLSYLGQSPALFKKYSIISECSLMPDSFRQGKPALQEDSFDVQWDDCYASKLQAQLEWNER